MKDLYIGNDDSYDTVVTESDLSWLKANLHAPRLWVHVSLLHRKQEVTVVSFHFLRFLGEGKVPYVRDMQNEGLLALQVMISMKNFIEYDWAT